MAAEQIESPVLRIEDPNRDRDTTNDRIPFQIDDDPHVLWATRPKKAILMNLAKMAEADDEAVLMGLFDLYLTSVLDEASRDYVQARLDDPTDLLDIDFIEPLNQSLVGRWYGRPTGSRPASAPSQRRTGKGSTVRSRSRA